MPSPIRLAAGRRHVAAGRRRDRPAGLFAPSPDRSMARRADDLGEIVGAIAGERRRGASALTAPRSISDWAPARIDLESTRRRLSANLMQIDGEIGAKKRKNPQ